MLDQCALELERTDAVVGLFEYIIGSAEERKHPSRPGRPHRPDDTPWFQIPGQRMGPQIPGREPNGAGQKWESHFAFIRFVVVHVQRILGIWASAYPWSLFIGLAR